MKMQHQPAPVVWDYPPGPSFRTPRRVLAPRGTDTRAASPGVPVPVRATAPGGVRPSDAKVHRASQARPVRRGAKVRRRRGRDGRIHRRRREQTSMTTRVGRVTSVSEDGRVSIQTPASHPRPQRMDRDAAVAVLGLAFAEAWKVRTHGGRPIPETIYHELAGRGVTLIYTEGAPDGE